jgi:hypothetical protein
MLEGEVNFLQLFENTELNRLFYANREDQEMHEIAIKSFHTPNGKTHTNTLTTILGGQL